MKRKENNHEEAHTLLDPRGAVRRKRHLRTIRRQPRQRSALSPSSPSSALVALAVGFAMAARKVDPEARFKKKPKSVTKMKSKPVKAKDLMVGQLHLHRLGDHRVLAKR